MENSIGERIRSLRNHYNLSVKEFAAKCGLSHVAIFHLESGKTSKPHRGSLQRIASMFGTTADWLMYGKNDMLPNGEKEIYGDINGDHFWKEEAYQEIKNRNLILEKEIERLWEMIGHFTTGSKPDLHRILDAG
jgi:transcriptional regulator with XRE-family HTH domain